MNQLIHADIFFFITSVVVILLGILSIVLFVYVIRIIRDLSHITSLAKKQSDDIAADIADFRQNVREKSHSFKSILMLLLKTVAPRHKRAHKNKTNDNETE